MTNNRNSKIQQSYCLGFSYGIKSIALVVIFYLVTGFSAEKMRIACVGNSITFGAGIENRDKNSYPAQLADLLGPEYEVGNFGISGATLLKKGNLPYWNTKGYEQALKFKPDLVYIKLGTNDSKPVNRIFLKEFIQDYKDLIASFQQLESHPKVVLLLPVPVFSTDTTSITATVISNKILPMVRQVAYDSGCEVINLYNLFIESPGLFPDKVHPSAAGATFIAKRIYEHVKMASGTAVNFAKLLPKDAKPFNFYGFQGYDFTFRNRNAKIVVPKHVAAGRPWIWRARFWGHEPQADIALLERGFHVVYCDVAELFGNKEAVSIWNDFYKGLTRAGLAQKSVMEGMSRGGVYVYRWAATYPNRIAGIYADAPVLDLKSWPGGKGKSKGSVETWEVFKNDFNLKTEEDAMAFKGNPLDLVNKIAKAGFPMLHVVGDADDIVPVSENTALFEKRIKERGGVIQVIHKPAVGHHPHSLPNPQPIVDFAMNAMAVHNF